MDKLEWLEEQLKIARRMGKRLVKLSEKNYRIGEDHQRAKLSDKEVDDIRTLYEEGGFRQGVIADVFEVSKHTIGRICRYERRNTTFAKTKVVHISEDKAK